MAIGVGTGGETNAPLARAVVGGLSVSTLLTLFLVPTMYLILEEHFPRRLEEETNHHGAASTGTISVPG